MGFVGVVYRSIARLYSICTYTCILLQGFVVMQLTQSWLMKTLLPPNMNACRDIGAFI